MESFDTFGKDYFLSGSYGKGMDIIAGKEEYAGKTEHGRTIPLDNSIDNNNALSMISDASIIVTGLTELPEEHKKDDNIPYSFQPSAVNINDDILKQISDASIIVTGKEWTNDNQEKIVIAGNKESVIIKPIEYPMEQNIHKTCNENIPKTNKECFTDVSFEHIILEITDIEKEIKEKEEKKRIISEELKERREMLNYYQEQGDRYNKSLTRAIEKKEMELEKLSDEIYMLLDKKYKLKDKIKERNK